MPGARPPAGNPLLPIAIEVVRRIDALFEIERTINGESAEQRLQVRQTLSRPVVNDLRSICGSSSPSRRRVFFGVMLGIFVAVPIGFLLGWYQRGPSPTR
jgi:hypothetical protein